MDSIMKETWKDIENYEGLYKISNFGQIKSLRKWDVNSQKYVYKEKILKSINNGNGYLYIFLQKNKQRKRYYIHRLVAKHFLNNYDENKVINHKDYNKQNNNINNLECITQKENILYSIKNMKHPQKNSKNKIGERYIKKRYNKYELTMKRKYIGSYKTLEEAIKVRNQIMRCDDYYGNI